MKQWQVKKFASKYIGEKMQIKMDINQYKKCS